MTASSIRAATVQFEARPGDKDYNLGRIRHFVAEAAAQGVQMLAFPEMCVTGYWFVRNLDRAGLEALAEPVPDGPSVTALRALAGQHGMLIGAGLIERGDDGRLHNTYAVCMPDGQVHAHRKLHAFEHEHIHSGDGYTVFDTPWGVRAGVLICWDNNLIENARATALLGASVLLAPHQTGGTNSRSPHAMKPIPLERWQRRAEDPAAIEAEFRGPNGREWLLRWLPSRAHDNGMFLLFSNGVGQDDDEVRTGNAMLLDPYGRILAETWAAADALVVADLDLTLLPLCSGRRWMQGRRPELYGILTERRGDERNAREARFSEAPVRR
ncbi:hydrolase [Chitiniphilus shinanonensis]|uniref:Hydrolase n=1 Tax=Chitiniphilus shinanonensis TaxID=553088 RepID=A0ABQ6BXT0_9NEIS|nr:nitrilase family protein [Chitiniphilus shinanonensis]GLS06222.1 hydrolase [Chitiniphilus shinanonensis]